MTAVKQTGLLIQWQLRRGLASLPLLILVQTILAVATIIGFGFLAGDLDQASALFLATGAPTITLVTVGLVMTPQEVGQAKKEGSLDWLHSLPLPRPLFLIADLAMWTLIAIPGLALAVLVGVWRYGLSLSLSPWLPVTILLVSLTAASIGYALAVLLSPTVAMLISQVLVFVVLLFSPVSFPAERMPEWLQQVHHWLPFEPMAQLIRGGFASEAFDVPVRSVIVLVAWCVISVVAAASVLTKRR